jgi:hypothetical protein
MCGYYIHNKKVWIAENNQIKSVGNLTLSETRWLRYCLIEQVIREGRQKGESLVQKPDPSIHWILGRLNFSQKDMIIICEIGIHIK